MMPANQSEQDFSNVFSAIVDKCRTWIKEEIVDDDPWDQETLFSDNLETESESSESRDVASSDRSNPFR